MIARVAIFAAIVAASPPAAADPTADRARARTLFDAGRQRYAAKDYLSAADRFREAYALDPDPVYLFNAAQAYRAGDACANAAAYYRRFLAVAVDVQNLEKVRRYIDQEDACARLQPPEPLEPGPPVPPPTPTPVVPIPPPVEPAPPRVVPLAPAPPHRDPTLAISLAAAGALGVAVGVTAQIGVHRAESEITRLCTRPMPCEDTAIREVDSRGNRDTAIAIGAYVVGGAALAGSIAAYVLGGQRASAERSVVAVPTAHGASVVARWTF